MSLAGIEDHKTSMPHVRPYPPDVHKVRILNHDWNPLLMDCSCRGLRVLVDILDEDYIDQGELVSHALNGIGSVFELQSPTPKNDFCRMFIREGLLDPLSSALINVISAKENMRAAEMKIRIIQIILVFSQVSQSDAYVRNAIGTRKVIRSKSLRNPFVYST